VEARQDYHRITASPSNYGLAYGPFTKEGHAPSNDPRDQSCIVAAVVRVVNHFGYGPFTLFPIPHRNEACRPAPRR
jgi:hypothetical protein